MGVKYDRKQANLDFGVDSMLIGAMEVSHRNRTLSRRRITAINFTIVKYLHFSSILHAYIHCFTAFSGFILHFSHRSRHIPIVSFSPTKGVVISLMLFYMTNIPKTPVLSAFPCYTMVRAKSRMVISLSIPSPE